MDLNELLTKFLGNRQRSMMQFLKLSAAFILGIGLWSCGSDSQSDAPTPPTVVAVPTPPPVVVSTDPLFPNSIVSNSLSFIELSDQSNAYCLALTGRQRKEMPGGPTDDLFEDDVFIFEANYVDGTNVEIWATSRFQSETTAQTEVDEIAKRLALFPTFMRETLNHVILHVGDDGAFAEDIANFFVVYEDNMKFRRSENDMEETLFHESVHATMDNEFRDGDPKWANAQQTDPGFITDYAEEVTTEDMAESAVFAFTDKYSPGRLPEDVTAAMYDIMPNRIAYLQSIFPNEAEYFETLRDAKVCP